MGTILTLVETWRRPLLLAVGLLVTLLSGCNPGGGGDSGGPY